MAWRTSGATAAPAGRRRGPLRRRRARSGGRRARRSGAGGPPPTAQGHGGGAAGAVVSASAVRCNGRHRVAPDEVVDLPAGTTLALAWSDKSYTAQGHSATPVRAGAGPGSPGAGPSMTASARHPPGRPYLRPRRARRGRRCHRAGRGLAAAGPGWPSPSSIPNPDGGPRGPPPGCWPRWPRPSSARRSWRRLNLAAARAWPAFARDLEADVRAARALPGRRDADRGRGSLRPGRRRPPVAFHRRLGLRPQRLGARACRRAEPLLAPGISRGGRAARRPPGRQPGRGHRPRRPPAGPPGSCVVADEVDRVAWPAAVAGVSLASGGSGRGRGGGGGGRLPLGRHRRSARGGRPPGPTGPWA